MKNVPFILLLFGIMLIWLGLTGRLGTVLAAIFEPSKLIVKNGKEQSASVPSTPSNRDTISPPGWQGSMIQGGLY